MTTSYSDSFSVLKPHERPSTGQCSICLEPYGPSTPLTRVPFCAHIFHGPCINDWLWPEQSAAWMWAEHELHEDELELVGHNSCPLCRCEFFPAKARPYMKNDEFVDSEPTDEEARRTRPRREWALYLQLQGVDPARVPLCFTKENGFGYNLREVSMGREERFEEELGVWHEKKLLEELVRLGAFLEPHSGRNGYPSGWD